MTDPTPAPASATAPLAAVTLGHADLLTRIGDAATLRAHLAGITTARANLAATPHDQRDIDAIDAMIDATRAELDRRATTQALADEAVPLPPYPGHTPKFGAPTIADDPGNHPTEVRDLYGARVCSEPSLAAPSHVHTLTSGDGVHLSPAQTRAYAAQLLAMVGPGTYTVHIRPAHDRTRGEVYVYIADADTVEDAITQAVNAFRAAYPTWSPDVSHAVPGTVDDGGDVIDLRR